MPGKWSWLLEEVGLRKLLASPLVYNYILGRVRGASDLVKCALCANMCRHACPVSIVGGRETTSPAGKARLATLADKGFVELDSSVAAALYACLSCDACKRWCPFEFSVADLLRPLKARALASGLAPPGVRAVLSNLRRYGYAYGEPKPSREQKGELLYLAGCTAREYFPEIAEKSVRLLESMGFNVAVVNEKCCGVPAYYAGDVDLARDLAETLMEQVRSSGAETVVTSCPSCAHALLNLYPGFGARLKQRVLHMVELLAEHLDKLGPRGRGLRVTYHDPCKLSHALGLPEALRGLLVKLGVEVADPRRRGLETFCCGYGGGLAFSHQGLADEVARERLSELLERADVVVTACPACKLAFTRAGGRALDIAELAYGLVGGGEWGGAPG